MPISIPTIESLIHIHLLYIYQQVCRFFLYQVKQKVNGILRERQNSSTIYLTSVIIFTLSLPCSLQVQLSREYINTVGTYRPIDIHAHSTVKQLKQKLDRQ